MYLPSHFEESRPEVLHTFIRKYPLGLLITHGASGLQADPIPFMLEPERGPHGTLIAHVARANPLWRESRTDIESMVVFQGPQAYISPAWYATKQETGKVVPTWNYCVVQARGRLRAIDDPAWVHRLVSRLTDRHEAERAGLPSAPWKVTDAPDDYIASMQRAIVGIEIELTALQGKWKLSQNRSEADRAGVVAGLAQQGADEAGAGVATLVATSLTTPGTQT